MFKRTLFLGSCSKQAMPAIAVERAVPGHWRRPLTGQEEKARSDSRECHTFSSTSAIPCPTPMHMVHSAYLPPVVCRRLTAVVASRAPLAPSG